MIQKTFVVTELSDLDAIAQWIIDESVNVGKPEDTVILITVTLQPYQEDL